MRETKVGAWHSETQCAGARCCPTNRWRGTFATQAAPASQKPLNSGVSRMNPESVRIYLVAAMGANRVIGNGPDIPWNIPGEQKIFRRLTEGKVVVMGRKTFESIGKPLPNRRTVVLSRQASYSAAGCAVVSTLSQAIAIAAEHGKELYVAGGAEVYALALPRADGVFLSEVHQTFEGDAFFPVLDAAEFDVVSAETVQATITYTHSVYARRNG